MDVYKQKLLKAAVVFTVVLSVLVVALILATLKWYGTIGSDVPPQATISVSGEGEVFATPDIAEFSFGVREERATVEEAQEAAAVAINNAIEFLEDHDIEEKDIRTQSIALSPRYEFRRREVVCVTFPCPQPPAERVLVGYEASQRVSVKVRDIDDAGEVLSGLGTLGVTEINGPTFLIDDEDELVREARKMAIEDAQEKAKILAKDLGVRLVRIVSFNESGRGVHPPFRAFAESAALGVVADTTTAPDIPAGENRIASNVNVVYEIR